MTVYRSDYVKIVHLEYYLQDVQLHGVIVGYEHLVRYFIFFLWQERFRLRNALVGILISIQIEIQFALGLLDLLVVIINLLLVYRAEAFAFL